MARQDKTEAPTAKRRQEARRKGQVARSIEINSAAVIIAGIYGISLWGGEAVQEIMKFMRTYLLSASWAGASLPGVGNAVSAAGLTLLKACGPIVAICLVSGVLANFAQVGFLVTFEQIIPRLSKLDPAQGFARMFSGRALIELLKASVKIAIVGYVGYSAVRSRWEEVVRMSQMDIMGMIGLGLDLLRRVALHVGMTFAIISFVDYVYQRREFEANLKMTKEEVKEEFRQMEGDPHLRARIRARQRQIAMHRMMQKVPDATVVVTNPTEIAVALKYDPATMSAPRVVAKGQRLVAARIKEIARAHGVPIVENKPLAQALYKAVDIDQEIPPHLYRATAEILAYVYSLNKIRKGGAGSWH